MLGRRAGSIGVLVLDRLTGNVRHFGLRWFSDITGAAFRWSFCFIGDCTGLELCRFIADYFRLIRFHF